MVLPWIYRGVQIVVRMHFIRFVLCVTLIMCADVSVFTAWGYSTISTVELELKTITSLLRTVHGQVQKNVT